MKIDNYIGGELVRPASGQYLENFDPATGQAYSLIPDSDDRDVNLAADAAAAAFSAWEATPPEERFEVLMRLVRLIERDAEELAIAECVDNGKPLALARQMDIPRAAANFRFYATAAMHAFNESHDTTLPGGGRAVNYTLRRPVGVAGCISPWNLPLYLFTWKVAPAIAAPTFGPVPWTMFSTPSGIPASMQSFDRMNAVMGVTSLGFTTTVQPAAIAGATFHVKR
jgi:aminomuconate-semialdehyde/2-hydroxymuconate-6-semialdehyde dehydrogenase